MGYEQSWKWETRIADARLFAAWSRDVEYLQTYLATPGRLLAPEGLPTLSEEQLRTALADSPEAIRSLEEIIPLLRSYPGIYFIDTNHVPDPEPAPPLIIRGPDGEGKPLFTLTEVAFNGDGSTNDSCQAFYITLQDMETPTNNSCKTLKRSYDLLVVCALVRLAHFFPTICIDSDGGKAAVERGVKICQQVFGEATFPRQC